MGVVTYLCLFGFLVSYSFPGGEVGFHIENCILTAFALPIFFFLYSSLHTAKARSCPRNWLKSQGSCYAYFDSKKTWSEAENECLSYGCGTHLASILNEKESDVVANYISANQKNASQVWIGLHDPTEKGHWRWLDDEIYNYKRWDSHRPDNYNNEEYCVHLLMDTGFKKWNDVKCNNKYAFICKQ
ncbi:C-type lectin BpLec-like [Podarcis raffonei]|uniref:C-type lectin BpLec-like n=1 Tax=Podarcis raffonei TaxID=65483 RepID=UPI002329306E|nr:C-type lectin BpLec-like [Podarcis raffonei]